MQVISEAVTDSEMDKSFNHTFVFSTILSHIFFLPHHVEHWDQNETKKRQPISGWSIGAVFSLISASLALL